MDDGEAVSVLCVETLERPVRLYGKVAKRTGHHIFESNAAFRIRE